MTKLGFKQVMLGIDTYGMLKKIAVNEKTSIDRIIKGFLIGDSLALGANLEGVHGFKSHPSH
jgi:hypothetical protein